MSAISTLRIAGAPKPAPWKRWLYHSVEKPGGGHWPNDDRGDHVDEPEREERVQRDPRRMDAAVAHRP
jgi:hypothetical protein